MSGSTERRLVAVARSPSPEVTRSMGRALGAVLASGDLVLLTGPLGSGKTCFVSGLAEGLGVAGRIKSPSFTLVHEHRGDPPLTHVDLYRLEGQETSDLGLEEALDRGVLVVEWGELLPSGLRQDGLWLTFRIVSANERTIEARALGTRGESTLAAWRARAEARLVEET